MAPKCDFFWIKWLIEGVWESCENLENLVNWGEKSWSHWVEKLKFFSKKWLLNRGGVKFFGKNRRFFGLSKFSLILRCFRCCKFRNGQEFRKRRFLPKILTPPLFNSQFFERIFHFPTQLLQVFSSQLTKFSTFCSLSESFSISHFIQNKSHFGAHFNWFFCSKWPQFRRFFVELATYYTSLFLILCDC